ncbi:MAG: hypothetical protein IKG56_04195 [Clostridia bacterium]|nr:hypothetical protein [Clostridia bacterium]
MKYNHRSVFLEEVVKDIDEYIIPECQKACQCFWDNNIITSMCSNYDDGNNKWITIDQLSDENKAIFEKLMEEDPEHYAWDNYYNKYQISASGVGEDVSDRLVKLAQVFKMQDVIDYSGEAYESVENYLMKKFGLSKTIPNPDYKEVPEPQIQDFEDISSYLKAMEEWSLAGMEPKTIEVFDESKMTKTKEEYICEAGVSDLYDAERGVIYSSQFYKGMHERYLEYMRTKQHDEEAVTNTRKTPDYEDDGDR